MVNVTQLLYDFLIIQSYLLNFQHMACGRSLLWTFKENDYSIDTWCLSYQPSNVLNNTFRFKNQLTKYHNSKVIYKFTCNACNSVYLGKTKCHLFLRQYEHLRKSIFTDKNLWYSDKDATAIRKHCLQHSHTASLDSCSVLGNAVNNYHLLFTIWQNHFWNWNRH